jgi:hypothetical protein
MQVLFPKTYQKFRSFDLARYKEIGKELKLVFDDDLSGTLTNLINHVETPVSAVNSNKFRFLVPDVCQKIRQQPSFSYLKVSAQVGQKLINGVHPSDILNYLDNTYYTNTSPVVIKPNYTETNPSNLTISVSESTSFTLSQPSSVTAKGQLSAKVDSTLFIFPTPKGGPINVSLNGSATLTNAKSSTVVNTTALIILSIPVASTLVVSGLFNVNSPNDFSMITTNISSLTTNAGSVTLVSAGGISINTPSSASVTLSGKMNNVRLTSGAVKLEGKDSAERQTSYNLNGQGTIPIIEEVLSGTLTSIKSNTLTINGHIEIPIYKSTRHYIQPDFSLKSSLAVSGSATVTLSESATGVATGPIVITATSASIKFDHQTSSTVTGVISLANGTDTTITVYKEPQSLLIDPGATLKLLGGTITVPKEKSLSLITDGAATLISERSLSLSPSGEARIEAKATTPVGLTLTGDGQANLSSGTTTLTHSYTTGTTTPLSATSPATISTTGMSLTGTLGGTIVFVPAGAGKVNPMHQFGDAVHFYNILQQSLRDTSAINDEGKASVWINFEKLNKLKSVAEKTYFLALLYHDDPQFFNQKGEEYLGTSFTAMSSLTLSTGNINCSTCLTAFNTVKSKNIASILSILTRMDEYIRLKKISLTDEQNFLPFMQMTGELVQLGFSFTNNSPVVSQKIRRYADLGS